MVEALVGRKHMAGYGFGQSCAGIQPCRRVLTASRRKCKWPAMTFVIRTPQIAGAVDLTSEGERASERAMLGGKKEARVCGQHQPHNRLNPFA